MRKRTICSSVAFGNDIDFIQSLISSMCFLSHRPSSMISAAVKSKLRLMAPFFEVTSVLSHLKVRV